jgi:hypothetical protein
MCESYEPTAKENLDLCLQAVFSYESQVKLNQLQTILIYQKS